MATEEIIYNLYKSYYIKDLTPKPVYDFKLWLMKPCTSSVIVNTFCVGIIFKHHGYIFFFLITWLDFFVLWSFEAYLQNLLKNNLFLYVIV